VLGLFLASLALSVSLVGASLLPGEIDLDASAPTPLRSLRFWILSLLGFGLAGLPLSMLAVAPCLTVGIAALTGVALGRVLWPIFEDASGEVTLSGLVGAEGRAVLAIGPDSGKIVVQTLANRVELPARSGDGTSIPAGRRVMVAFVEEGVARVIGL
jgi:hypothetical protein